MIVVDFGRDLSDGSVHLLSERVNGLSLSTGRGRCSGAFDCSSGPIHSSRVGGPIFVGWSTLRHRRCCRLLSEVSKCPFSLPRETT